MTIRTKGNLECIVAARQSARVHERARHRVVPHLGVTQYGRAVVANADTDQRVRRGVIPNVAPFPVPRHAVVRPRPDVRDQQRRTGDGATIVPERDAVDGVIGGRRLGRTDIFHTEVQSAVGKHGAPTGERLPRPCRNAVVPDIGIHDDMDVVDVVVGEQRVVFTRVVDQPVHLVYRQRVLLRTGRDVRIGDAVEDGRRNRRQQGSLAGRHINRVDVLATDGKNRAVPGCLRAHRRGQNTSPFGGSDHRCLDRITHPSFKLPVTAQQVGTGVVAGGGHVGTCRIGQCLDKGHPVRRLGDITSVQKDVRLFGKRRSDGCQFVGMLPGHGIHVQRGIAQFETPVRTVADDVDRIHARAPLENLGDLLDTVAISVQHIDFARVPAQVIRDARCDRVHKDDLDPLILRLLSQFIAVHIQRNNRVGRRLLLRFLCSARDFLLSKHLCAVLGRFILRQVRFTR